MKNFKFLYLLLAAVGVVTFTSCTEEWTPGAKDTNMGVFFPEVGRYEVSADDTSVDIAVARNNADAAASISLRYEAKDAAGEVVDFFTLPASVEFAAGQSESVLSVEFDASQFVLGQPYSLTVKLNEEEASTYGISEATFTFLIPEPWSSIGEGIYIDELLCYRLEEVDSFIGAGAYVEFEQHDLEKNRVRAKNVYAQETIGAMWGGVPSWMPFTATGDTYVEFDIADPNNVIAGQVLEFENEDGSTAQACAYPLYIQASTSTATYDLYCLTWMDSPIVLEGSVINFPTDGSVELAAFSGGEYQGYFAQANLNGFLQFYLPGAEFVDYSIEASYEGMYVPADGSTAMAIFDFYLGTDVYTYKFAFVPGDVTADPSAVAEAIVAGSEELEIFESDPVTVSWQIELSKGIWTLVAVPYSVEGEARLQDTYALNFYFNGTGEMPEVNLDVLVGSPASFAAEDKKAEVEAKTPACYNIAINIAGNPDDLKSMKAWWGSEKSYESALSQGLNDDKLLSDYAANLYIDDFTSKMAESGAVTIYVNVANFESKYKVLFRAETIYGTVINKTIDYTLPEYDGSLAVGTYTFTQGEGEDAVALNFTVYPAKSYKDFYFVHDDVDGSAWYVTYDEATGTLTNEGILLGYEDEGSQFGGLYGYFNQEKTQVYGYVSSKVETYETMDPMVMTVEDGAITGLQTYYGMLVYAYDAATQKVGDVLGTYYNFTPSTVIAPAVAAQSIAPMFETKSVELKPCVADSAFASEVSLVIKATPVARTFTMANFSL